MKKNIAVIFGGLSSEHDISIITAHQILNNLDTRIYRIIPIYINKEGKWFSGEKLFNIKTFNKFKANQKGIFKISFLPSSNFLYKKVKVNKLKKLCRIDCALIAMHGVNGEDGSLQGLFELANIPYTSSNVLSSSLCMDKVLMKRAFESLEFPVLDWLYILRDNIEKDFDKIVKKIEKSFNFPVIVKPANLGSSIGISVCHNKQELLDGLKVASEYDKKIIIEKAITNLKEVNCSVIGYGEDCRASVLEEPISYTKFLTFEEKYIAKIGAKDKGGMINLKRVMPAKVSKSVANKIKDLSLKAFKELECSGVVRIDFILDKDTKKVYINEINTIPGSFAFYLWQFEGVSFKYLLYELIEFAEKKFIDKQKNKHSFESSVILNFSGGVKTGKIR